MITVLVVAILVTAVTLAAAISLLHSLLKANALKPIPVPARYRRSDRP